MPAKAIDFEAWAANQGVSRFSFGDAGMHAKGHGNETKWKRELKLLAEQMRNHEQRREALRDEYNRLVESGELRPLNRLERLEFAAMGNPDLPSVQAAKRLLEKELRRLQESS